MFQQTRVPILGIVENMITTSARIATLGIISLARVAEVELQSNWAFPFWAKSRWIWRFERNRISRSHRRGPTGCAERAHVASDCRKSGGAGQYSTYEAPVLEVDDVELGERTATTPRKIKKVNPGER